ncbi:hypothetical protein SPHINGOR109_50347 [Sphingorhabdus sp. 109]|nr:hypothetical protein SPHINGOR109_50347 [Sphingorhabdus sp. 109]
MTMTYSKFDPAAQNRQLLIKCPAMSLSAYLSALWTIRLLPSPGIICTTAFTSSPRSILGTPKTAASTTRGCSIRRFSHSCG